MKIGEIFLHLRQKYLRTIKIMRAKEKREFVASNTSKHFKIDKQTKRMMALTSFPTTVRLSEAEQKDLDVVIEPLTRNGFKKLMIRSQLSDIDSKLTGMDDPLWKPDKKAKIEDGEGTEGTAGTAPSSNTPNKRKGKKAPKMRRESEGVSAAAPAATEGLSDNNG
jgi:hypothetical protein